MGLFDSFGGFGGGRGSFGGGGIIGDIMSIRDMKREAEKAKKQMEDIKMLFTDVETEGKKQGYEQAAHEYDRAYSELNAECERLMKAIEADKSSNNAKANELIGKLGNLEQKRRELEQRFNDKAQDVARKWDMSVGDVKKACMGGDIGGVNPFFSSIIGLWADHKRKKMAEARARGYAEARELFEQKIRSLKAKLNELKAGAADSMKMFIGEIAKLVDAISLEEHKIAQLQSML